MDFPDLITARLVRSWHSGRLGDEHRGILSFFLSFLQLFFKSQILTQKDFENPSFKPIDTVEVDRENKWAIGLLGGSRKREASGVEERKGYQGDTPTQSHEAGPRAGTWAKNKHPMTSWVPQVQGPIDLSAPLPPLLLGKLRLGPEASGSGPRG